MSEQLVFDAPVAKMTARFVLDALHQRHKPRYNGRTPDWITFEELSGHATFNPRRIDLWAMNCWASKRQMTAYEVKVSRSDFLHEMKQPQKRRYALLYSNLYYFATWRDCLPPSWNFVAALGRRMFAEVAAARGATEEGGKG